MSETHSMPVDADVPAEGIIEKIEGVLHAAEAVASGVAGGVRVLANLAREVFEPAASDAPNPFL